MAIAACSNWPVDKDCIKTSLVDLLLWGTAKALFLSRLLTVSGNSDINFTSKGHVQLKAPGVLHASTTRTLYQNLVKPTLPQTNI
eukprot:2126772-Amphidinium_carterae.1